VFRNILDNKKYKTTADAFDAWREYVLSFGFGRKLGSDFPSELGGNIPTSAYYNKAYGRKGWRFQTIISLSIGQGEIGVTPLQIANLCATVANRGWYIIPHIIKDSRNVTIDDKYKERQYTLVDTMNFKKVINGMYMAVNGGGAAGGTAYAAAGSVIDATLPVIDPPVAATVPPSERTMFAETVPESVAGCPPSSTVTLILFA
jgi:penicillin-binding protein 2